MKQMKLLLCAMLLFVVCGCTKPDGEKELISIDVKIEDTVSGTVLFEGELSSEGVDQTLADVLQANADKIQLISEKTAFGLQLNGLMGLETTDWSKGPWWLYTSENNESCVEAGYCTGASELKVATGDEFTFSFSSGY